MKTKIYYKELMPLFIFQTVAFGLMFLMMYYEYNPEVCKQSISILPIIGWVICTGFMLSFVKFKKQ